MNPMIMLINDAQWNVYYACAWQYQKGLQKKKYIKDVQKSVETESYYFYINVADLFQPWNENWMTLM